jgi:hypothetical protein
MMISPDMFVELHKHKKYEELLTVRDELIKEIREFETKTYDPEMDNICPSPDVIYQVNLLYLGQLCELISEKYNEEYIRGAGGDS